MTTTRALISRAGDSRSLWLLHASASRTGEEGEGGGDALRALFEPDFLLRSRLSAYAVDPNRREQERQTVPCPSSRRGANEKGKPISFVFSASPQRVPSGHGVL